MLEFWLKFHWIFVLKGIINNIPVLVQILAWPRSGKKPLSEPIMFSKHIDASSEGWFNTNMPSYQYMKSHCRDKTILRPSYLHNGISYTGKM